MHDTTRAEIVDACIGSINALTTGYTERVEYSVKKGKATEKRVENRAFPGLIPQLRERAADPYATKAGGPTNNPNKSTSRPPVDQAMLDYVDHIDEKCTQIVAWLRQQITVVDNSSRRDMRSPESKLREIQVMVGSSLLRDADAAQVMGTMAQFVSRAREMLGHESRRIMLADMVCHECGGGLSVAQDASTDVECVGAPDKEPCGTSYSRLEWLSLLNQGE